MSPEALRVGLIGAGMIGRLRARAIGAVPALRLAAVADARRELAEAVTGGDDSIAVYGDGMELAGSDDLEAVIVATPPDSHETLALACLRGGKHVLCEKPLATTVGACERMVEAAATSGRSLATGFTLRYTRAALLARRIVDEGGIGELDHVRAFHGHPGGAEFTHDWIRDTAVTGGGTLMDNGIHVIDLARWFLGDVVEATGMESAHTWGSSPSGDGVAAEDNGFLLLRNRSGNIATIHSSWTEWRGYGYRVEIYGTTGFVRFAYPPLLLTHGRRGDDGRTRLKRHLFPAYQVAERVRGWEWGLVETLIHDLQAWAASLCGGTPPPISGVDGLEAVRIAAAATSSGAVVDDETTNSDDAAPPATRASR